MATKSASARSPKKDSAKGTAKKAAPAASAKPAKSAAAKAPAKAAPAKAAPVKAAPAVAPIVHAPPPTAVAPEPTVPATSKPDQAKVAHPKEKGTRHLRAPIEIRVEITARSQSFTTTSRNIALGGISFESSTEFRIGDLVNVLLYIPVKKELDLLKVASEVVWVEDVSGSWMIGAAFRKFAPGDERRLRAWLIESVAAQKAGRPYGM